MFYKNMLRFDAYTMVDFRIQKTFQIYKSWRIHAFADIFNLLNDDTYTSHFSYSLWQSNYLEPSYMPYPRRVQVGVKIEF